MKVWASRKSVRAEIADVPEGWLDRFLAARPDDVRKFGDSRNSTLVFRTSAVLEAVERGEFFRGEGKEGLNGEKVEGLKGEREVEDEVEVEQRNLTTSTVHLRASTSTNSTVNLNLGGQGTARHAEGDGGEGTRRPTDGEEVRG